MELPNIFHRHKRPIFLHHTLYRRLLYFYVCNKIVPLSAYNSVHICLELWCREPICVNNLYFMTDDRKSIFSFSLTRMSNPQMVLGRMQRIVPVGNPDFFWDIPTKINEYFKHVCFIMFIITTLWLRKLVLNYISINLKLRFRDN